MWGLDRPDFCEDIDYDYNPSAFPEYSKDCDPTWELQALRGELGEEQSTRGIQDIDTLESNPNIIYLPWHPAYNWPEPLTSTEEEALAEAWERARAESEDKQTRELYSSLNDWTHNWNY